MKKKEVEKTEETQNNITTVPYADFGKNARDVFRTGYSYGLAKFKLLFRMRDEIQVGGEASYNLENRNVSGMAMGKYNTGDLGRLGMKINENGVVTVECAKDKLVDEVDVAASVTGDKDNSFTSDQLTVNYRYETMHSCFTFINKFDRNVNVTGAVAVGLKNIMIGYKTGYDTSSGLVTCNDVGACFNIQDIDFHLRCNTIPREFGLSAYYRSSPEMELAMNALFASKDDTKMWTFGVGAKFRLDSQCSLRLKLDKDLQLGMSLQQFLNPSILLTLGCSLDFANPSKGEHKVGIGMEINT